MPLYLVLQSSFLKILLTPFISYTFIYIHNYILVKKLLSQFSGSVSLTWNGVFTGFLSIISTIPVLSSAPQPVYSPLSGFYSTPNSHFPFILSCLYVFILYYLSYIIHHHLSESYPCIILFIVVSHLSC